jgi:hypothetical protein
MRCKVLMPVLLVVMMLSSACVAPVCQAACGVDCQSSTGAAMSGMKHCAMCVTAPVMGAVGAAVPCSHDVCEKERAPVGYAAAVQSSMGTPVVFIASVNLSGRFGVIEKPPSYRSSFSSSASSHTILRV